MSDSLYLIEILIQEVVCDNEEIDKSNVCVDVELGQIANFSIQLKEKPDIFNITLVNPGKSYLFPASPYVLKHQLPQSKISFTIKRPFNNKDINKTNVFQILGSTSMDWPISFRKLAEYSEKYNNLPPETVNEKLFYKDEGYGHSGHIKLFIRFSCFGHDIQTPYQVVQTKDEAMSYLFKGSKVPAPFRTPEYGQGGQKDLLPVGPLFINEDSFKKPSNYSLDLTKSEIESELCDKDDCIAAYKFKEHGIGPLSKKKKEIISPCGGKTCPYAHEIDDPPCIGHRKCKLYTPQRNKMQPNVSKLCDHSDEHVLNDENKKPATPPPVDQALFKPYIITPRKNYQRFSSPRITERAQYNSVNPYRNESTHSTDKKFSKVISGGTKNCNSHACKTRCNIPKRHPCCHNGHLCAGGDENGCCQQKCTVKTQTPEKPVCGKQKCKNRAKPCFCKPLCHVTPCKGTVPHSNCVRAPLCGMAPCGTSPCRTPALPCGTMPCGIPQCEWSLPPCIETFCVSPTICPDCGGYSRSGKTCKDLKKDLKTETDDYNLRVENLKCLCKSTPDLRFRKECSKIESFNNQISTQTEPNLIQKNSIVKLHAKTSTDSTTSGRKSTNTPSSKTTSSNNKYNPTTKVKDITCEMKPPFERLKSGAELPAGDSQNTTYNNLIRDMKRRKRALVYDIGNNYPGNRIGHKTCICKIPQCPSKKGWEWSPEPALPPFKPRKEYKPGFIPKDIQESINLAREMHGLPVINPVGAPKKKRRRGKSGSSRLTTAIADDEDEGDDEYEVEEKNTLTFQRKDGTYYIKMNPLRDPKTVKDNEDPYIHCPPIEFTYTKDPLKKLMLGENTCDCCTCEEDENSDNDELNIDFSPPMGIIEMERMKKQPNVVHFWTQYDESDVGEIRSTKQGSKRKGK